jgi:hypothetical protein
MGPGDMTLIEESFALQFLFLLRLLGLTTDVYFAGSLLLNIFSTSSNSSQIFASNLIFSFPPAVTDKHT